MKKIILALLVTCQSLTLITSDWAPFFDIERAAADGGLSIKLAAKDGLCGQIVLKPKELSPETIKWILEQVRNSQAIMDGIYLQAIQWTMKRRSTESQITNDTQAYADNYGPLVGPLQKTGLWQKYDWAGGRQDHYKISCFIKFKSVNPRNENDFSFQPVPCDWVVNFNEYGKHNIECGASTNASYEPLNMNKKLK